MHFLRWTVRWGDAVLATGAGPIPPEYGLPQPRVAHGDRAVVRNGALSAEAVLAPRPPRPFWWGAPDLHFIKVLAICLMAFAAVMVVIRERVAELQLAKVALLDEPDDIFTPRPARWGGHAGFSRSTTHHAPVAARDLERIKRFGGKVKKLEEREALFGALTAPRAGVLALLGTRRDDDAVELSSIFGSGGLGSGMADGLTGGIEGGIAGGTAGGVVGGLGLRGSGLGGGGTGEGTIGLGSLGTLGRGAGTGTGTGYGRGMGGLRLSAADPAGRSVLAGARWRLMPCLDGFEGTMTTDIELFDDGRVKSVVVTGPPQRVQRCVARHLEQLQFPGGETHLKARWTTG